MDSSGTNQKAAEAADASSVMTALTQTTPSDDDDDHPKLAYDDVIPEILYRLPPKYVLRSKLVSKTWQAMVSHPSFARQHAKLRDTERGALYGLLFFQWMFWLRSVALTYFEDGGRRWINGAQLGTGGPREQNYSVTNACRGMVCVLGATVEFLINPSIEEAVRLPGRATPHYDFLDNTPPAGGLVFDESTGRYDVVRAFRREDWSTGCEVFTLGRDDAWRRVKDSPVPISYKAPPVFFGGLLLWLMDDSMVHENNLNALVAFDPKKEAFVRVDLPKGSRAQTCRSGILELDGQLCYWERFNHAKSMTIWASGLNDFFQWKKLTCVRDLIVERCSWLEPRYRKCTWAPVATWKGQMILSNGRGQMAYYARNSNCFSPAETFNVPYGRVMSYSGTLLSPKAVLQKPPGAGEGGQAVQPDVLPMTRFPNIWKPNADGAADGTSSSSHDANETTKKKKVVSSEEDESSEEEDWLN